MDQIGSGAVLFDLAVDAALKGKFVRIGNFVRSHYARPYRAESVHCFAKEPLAPVFPQLPITSRDVVSYGVTEYVIFGRGDVNMFPLFPNNNSQFDFPIQFLSR